MIAQDWELRIHGMVNREVRFTYDDLLNRDLVEHDITLTCVSNTVGGDLLGTARWLGVPLRDLLDEAGIDPAPINWSVRRGRLTSGFPLEVLDDPDGALLAIGMNGEPLPLAHGFPVRHGVPGIYGYVSATKWLTELEVTRSMRSTPTGSSAAGPTDGPIRTMARIDTPRTLHEPRPDRGDRWRRLGPDGGIESRGADRRR